LRRFFFSSPPSAVFLAVAVFFFAAFGLDSVVVFAGALDAVDAGALPAVELGFGAIAIEVVEAESERERRARGWWGDAKSYERSSSSVLKLLYEAPVDPADPGPPRDAT
jgi:hypothetical protein